ncbi:MAG: class I SAM-dependent methyltransferase [Ignavibacteriae bacterium]|nr:class I SAM-dependent methyltransferase [Ignavibacteriota bacterium]
MNTLPDFRSWGGDKKFIPLTKEDSKGSINPPIIRHINSIVKQTGKPNHSIRILDFGCGRGELVCKLRHLGFDAYGIDIDHRFIEAGKILNEESKSLPILSTPDKNGKNCFNNEFFDIIISNQVLEHVENLSFIAEEMSRILKYNGSVCNLFPAKYRFVEPHYKLPLIHWMPKNIIRLYAIKIMLLMNFSAHLFPEYNLDERSRIIYKFSVEETFYRPVSQIIKVFRSAGIELESRSEMQHHLKSRKKFIGLITSILPIDKLVTNFRHVILTGKKVRK